MKPGPRFAYPELMPYLSAHFGRPYILDQNQDWGPFWVDDEAAVVLGTTRDTIGRWKREGLSLWHAEKAAVELGRMPWEIWPEWSEAADDWANRAVSRRRKKLIADVERYRRLSRVPA